MRNEKHGIGGGRLEAFRSLAEFENENVLTSQSFSWIPSFLQDCAWHSWLTLEAVIRLVFDLINAANNGWENCYSYKVKTQSSKTAAHYSVL